MYKITHNRKKVILHRQHHPTHTRLRKRTFNEQQFIRVQALTRMLRYYTKNAIFKHYIIDHHNDPENLRLLEALKIEKRKPEINSREKCAETPFILMFILTISIFCMTLFVVFILFLTHLHTNNCPTVLLFA